MKKYMIIALALLFAAGNVEAQSILDRAKGKVEQRINSKIDGAMDKALDKVFGKAAGQQGNSNAAAQPATGIPQAASAGYESASAEMPVLDNSWAANLMPASSDWTVELRQGYDEFELKRTVNFDTYAEAIAAIPAIPDAKTLISPKGMEEFAAQMVQIEAAADKLGEKYMSRNNELTKLSMTYSNKSKGGMPSAAAAIDPMEIMMELQKAGIDPSKASEAEMQKALVPYLAKKYGLSEEQAATMMASSLKQEESMDRVEAIAKELEIIYDARVNSALTQSVNAMNIMTAAILNGGAPADKSTLNGALMNLRKNIISAWPKSDEYKKINELAAKNGKKSAKEQNELIDKWNEKQMAKWIIKVNEFVQSQKTDPARIAELDTELEKMENKDSEWANAKLKSISLNGVIADYILIPAAVLSAPLVQHVEE